MTVVFIYVGHISMVYLNINRIRKRYSILDTSYNFTRIGILCITNELKFETTLKINNICSHLSNN